MLRTFLMSFVSERWGDPKTLRDSPGDGWLVWEPGEWKAPKRDKTLVAAKEARPRAGDALVVHLAVPRKKRGPYQAGRAPANDLVLNDATVSRVQFEIAHRDGRWLVCGVGGKTLLLNERPVDADAWANLSTGDRLAVGNITLTFLDRKGLGERISAQAPPGNSVDFVRPPLDHRTMNASYRVRAGVTFLPMPRVAESGQPQFAIRSPLTNGLLEISVPVVRILASFGTGALAEKIARELSETDAERDSVADSIEELARLGLLVPLSPLQPAFDTPLFVLSSPGSMANRLQDELALDERFASTPLCSLIQSTCDLHEKSLFDGDYKQLGIARSEQLAALRRSIGRQLEQFARRRQKPAWVYNSRDLDLYLPLVDDVFEGRAKYFAVVRNPLDTVFALTESFEQYGPQLSPRHQLRQLLREAPSREAALAHYWVGLYSRIRSFRASAGARVHIVRAESLSGPLPAAEYLKAFSFIGLNWTPRDDQRAVPKNPGRIDSPATTVLTGGVPRGKWKDGWSAEQLVQVSAIVDEEARAWGYTLEKGGKS